MYVDDRRSALHALATLVAPGGQLSATFGNGAALAFRPGIRRDWHAAVAAFGAASYVNELGVKARGRHPDQVAADQRPGHHLVRRPCSPTQPPRRTATGGPRRRPRGWTPKTAQAAPMGTAVSHPKSRDRGPTLIDHLRQTAGAHSPMPSRGLFSSASATDPGTTGTLRLQPGTLWTHRAGERHRWRAACAIAAAP